MFITSEISRLSNDGRFLYVDLRPRLDVYLRYAAWNDGLSVSRWDIDTWLVETYDPDISLVAPKYYENKDLPVYQFIHQIPEGIRKRVSPFQHLQTKLLQVCAQSWEAQQLLSDLPFLLWLIADYLKYKDLSSKQIKHLIRKKRKDILKEIFGRGSNADVKMLRKIRIHNQVLNENSLNAIKFTIRNDYSINLCHQSDIPLQQLIIIKQCPFLGESRLISMLASKTYPDQAAMMGEIREIGRLWRDISGLGDLLNMDSGTSLNRCDSMESLQNLHDQWTRTFNQMKSSVNDSQVLFPPAPIKGNQSIVQILNLEELKEEGRKMHHCVGSYSRKVIEGRSYIFKVLQPERATLEIKISGKDIRIVQFKCAYNKAPSENAVIAVVGWLDNYLNDNESAKIGSKGEIKV